MSFLLMGLLSNLAPSALAQRVIVQQDWPIIGIKEITVISYYETDDGSHLTEVLDSRFSQDPKVIHTFETDQFPQSKINHTYAKCLVVDEYLKQELGKIDQLKKLAEDQANEMTRIMANYNPHRKCVSNITLYPFHSIPEEEEEKENDFEENKSSNDGEDFVFFTHYRAPD